ncbi:MAG: hypothetical protein H0W08_26640 [Acidobacteria bacterium]|nr:hypothetical protein [Acidobacteriota bacterium]
MIQLRRNEYCAGHQAGINTVTFSPDGTRVATTSADGTVRLWPTDGTRQEVTLPHDSAVLSAGFSPDGRRLVTTVADGSVRVWGIDWSELVTNAGRRTTTCLSDDERRRYLGESPSDALRAFDECEASFGRPRVRVRQLPSIGDTNEPAKRAR